MAKVTPWSVKGVGPEARDKAKRGAFDADITIGAWVEQAIRDHAARENGESQQDSAQSTPDPVAVIETALLPLGRSVEMLATKLVESEKAAKRAGKQASTQTEPRRVEPAPLDLAGDADDSFSPELEAEADLDPESLLTDLHDLAEEPSGPPPPSPPPPPPPSPPSGMQPTSGFGASMWPPLSGDLAGTSLFGSPPAPTAPPARPLPDVEETDELILDDMLESDPPPVSGEAPEPAPLAPVDEDAPALSLDDLLAEDGDALDLEWEARQRAAAMARNEADDAPEHDPDDLDLDAEWAAHQRAAQNALQEDELDEQDELGEDALFGRRAIDSDDDLRAEMDELQSILADEIRSPSADEDPLALNDTNDDFDDGLTEEDRADILAAREAFSELEQDEEERREAPLAGQFPDEAPSGTPAFVRENLAPQKPRRRWGRGLAKAAAVLLVLGIGGSVAAITTGVAEPALQYGREHYPDETAKVEEAVASLSGLVDEIVADIVDAPPAGPDDAGAAETAQATAGPDPAVEDAVSATPAAPAPEQEAQPAQGNQETAESAASSSGSPGPVPVEPAQEPAAPAESPPEAESGSEVATNSSPTESASATGPADPLADTEQTVPALPATTPRPRPALEVDEAPAPQGDPGPALPPAPVTEVAEAPADSPPPEAATPVTETQPQPKAAEPETAKVAIVVPPPPPLPQAGSGGDVLGDDPPADPKRLFAWTERRAKDGNRAAQHDLAIFYVSGDVVPQDYEQAAYWFREAAIQGVANAQFNLGILYEYGWGVEKSDVRSLLWYHSAAESGHPKAQYNLGLFYFEGRGNPVNFTEARRWFERAGIANQAAGFFNLAKMEEAGLGAAPNMNAAKARFAQAALGGHKEAGPELQRILTGEADTSGAVQQAEIAFVQSYLRTRGLEVGVPDGLFGDRTRDAVISYQQQSNLEPSGVIDRALIERLLQDVASAVPQS